MSAWEAVVCTMSLELINHSSFHIQEEGKNLHSNLEAAVSLHSVPHRKSAKERKALWGQEGRLTSDAGYKTKSLSLRNATSGTCVVPLFLMGYIERGHGLCLKLTHCIMHTGVHTVCVYCLLFFIEVCKCERTHYMDT